MNHKLLSLITTLFALGTTIIVDSSKTEAVTYNLESEQNQNNEQQQLQPNLNKSTSVQAASKKQKYISLAQNYPQKISSKERQLAKIYTHKLNGDNAATLFIRSIPVLTFLESQIAKNTSKNTELVASQSDKNTDKPNVVNDPASRAKLVALKLAKLERKGLKAEDIKVRWNPESKGYSIKVKDREIVAIDDRTILPDTTKDKAEDALQATNRLRRLMGNAPPLREIIDMPRKIQARVEQIPQYRVLRQIVGQASWYGPGFHGRTTANGERYNQHGLTAAHPSLPFGTRIKVTNKNNGRSVVVRINDRGPYAGGRIIDLSAGAARIIGMMGSGVAPVQLEILGS
jgi:rare lipoprotein A